VKNRRWPIWPLALLGIVAGLLMGVGAVWLTDEVLMFAPGVAPVALTACAIVAYYELQTKRHLRMRDAAKLHIEPRRSRHGCPPCRVRVESIVCG
jgi:peptidoglycan/LPS O-acetylase OafA/YrhL